MLDLETTETVGSVTGPTLASTLAGDLREAIISGALPPGSKVNIDRVREQFGVSLSPLREALSRLFSEGFLTFQDKRGYRVAGVSEADLRQIITLRVNLESLALREAIAFGDPQWERDVADGLEVLRSIQRSSGDVEAIQRWEVAHRNFHFQLLSACGMPLLLNFAQTLHDLNDRYRRLFLKTQAPKRDTLVEHIGVANAAIERRSKDAVNLLRQHIEETGIRTLRELPRIIRSNFRPGL